MSDVECEIATQPECWRSVIGVLSQHSSALPARGERVAVVGCGSSYNMALAYSELREAAGHGETDAFTASEFRYGRSYDRVVALSRSGTTTEVVETLRRLTSRTTLITTVKDSPAGRFVSDAIVLSQCVERSVLQTRYATTSLALLRSSIGDDLGSAIADAEWMLRAPLPVDPAAHHHFTFLGVGWACGIAAEAALKCREAAAAWTESYPAMEFRHGPISANGKGSAVWVFGRVPIGLDVDIAKTGATFVHNGGVDPMSDLIRAQRLAVTLAHRAARDPDHPSGLSFSVVLPPGSV